MTVNTTTNRTSYAGNGTTTAFAVNFPFLANADLVVLLVTDATGAQTVQTLNTNYTVTGAGGTSGTVTMTVAPPTGTTLVIYRDPALTQLVHPVQNDPLPVDTALEQPLDRLTMITQRGREIDERSLRLPEGDTGFGAADMYLPPKITRASQYLAFDANGKPIAAALTGATTAVSPFMATLLDDPDAATGRATLGAADASLPVPLVFNTVADLRNNAVPASTARAIVVNYSASGDEGGGLFIWNSTSTAADDGATVIQPNSLPASGRWLRATNLVNVKTFGAKGDGVTDDRAAIQAAYNYASAANKALYFPSGTYLIGESATAGYSLTFSANVALLGDGPDSKLKGNGGNYRLITIPSNGTTSHVFVRGLHFDGGNAGSFGAENQNYCLLIDKANRVQITGCIFENCNEDGVYIGGNNTAPISNVVISNNLFKSTGRTGVAVISAYNVDISNNVFYQPSFQAIDIEPDLNTYYARVITVAGNIVFQGGDATIAVNRAAIQVTHKTGANGGLVGDIAVTGNTVRDFGIGRPAGVAGRGIYVSYQARVAVVGNTVTDAPEEGISVDNSSDITVSGNVATLNGTGISLVSNSNVHESGNISRSNTTNWSYSGNTQMVLAGVFAPKAVVYFDGTGAILHAYNVSSITKNGVGDYTINFGITFANTNYMPTFMGDDGGSNLGIAAVSARTTTTLRITTGSVGTGGGVPQDKGMRVAVFGEVA